MVTKRIMSGLKKLTKASTYKKPSTYLAVGVLFSGVSFAMQYFNRTPPAWLVGIGGIALAVSGASKLFGFPFKGGS